MKTWTISSLLVSTPDGRGYFRLRLLAFAFRWAVGPPPPPPPLGPSGPGGGGRGGVTVSSGGTVSRFGDAKKLGSLPASAHVTNIDGIAASPDGRGYWLVGKNGSVYHFGDAASHGSLAGGKSPPDIVVIASSPDAFFSTATGWLAAKRKGKPFPTSATLASPARWPANTQQSSGLLLSSFFRPPAAPQSNTAPQLRLTTAPVIAPAVRGQ